ncbi:hypothetical protein OD808_14810 [Aeromonas veronii]|uniref:hypothetical protein n=1 Tax=Aeromonas veronii TaxID=654 RepID=UPI002247F785|nr:hypothetical protein [Aeromonas veronii]MCX0432146.1 hypothetical protein [Aeromonas veronii]
MKVDMQLDQDKFRQAWQGFAGENWKHEINVRDFIQQNYTPYEGRCCLNRCSLKGTY